MPRIAIFVLAAALSAGGGQAPSPVVHSRAYRVGGVVKAPRVVKRVKPVYTETARKARVSGIVILEIIVDKKGFVRQERVLKPLPFGLDQAAVEAVRQWRFRPGTRYGRPVDVIFDVTVPFRP